MSGFEMIHNQMSENQYNAVIEAIKSNLVPKVELGRSKLESKGLKKELEKAKEELKKMNSKYEEEKLKNDIIQAEKECLEAEKKTFELKFNEISLKLKLKTNQYDSLLSAGKTDCKPTESAENHTMKAEPNEIGIVNVPDSSSSSIGTKRTSSVPADDQTKKAKRKKTTRSDSNTRNNRMSTRNERKFTCEYCIVKWGVKIERDFGGDPDKENAPDPRQIISTFSSFEALKNHNINDHYAVGELFCEEKSCLDYEEHSNLDLYAPHGENICEICDLSFKFKKHYDQHVATGHANQDMTNKQFYDLYLKYQNGYLLSSWASFMYLP